MMIHPIILFTYKRINHTKQLINSLKDNELSQNSELIIFSDGHKEKDFKEVDELRKYIRTVKGFKSVNIIEREKNLGLAENIISGLNEVFSIYSSAIILEDDLVVSPYFLRFMNDALNLYENDEIVGSIHGYIYPVKKKLPDTFFLKGGDCWGWATWNRAWKYFEKDGVKLLSELKKRKLENEFDFDGAYPYVKMLKQQTEEKNNSWAIRWYASLYLKNMLTLYPGKSFVKNQGADDSGTHLKTTNVFDTELTTEFNGITRIKTEVSTEAREIIKEYFFSIHPNPVKRFLRI